MDTTTRQETYRAARDAYLAAADRSDAAFADWRAARAAFDAGAVTYEDADGTFVAYLAAKAELDATYRAYLAARGYDRSPEDAGKEAQ